MLADLPPTYCAPACVQLQETSFYIQRQLQGSCIKPAMLRLGMLTVTQRSQPGHNRVTAM